jgi:nucleoside-diphosphate-sugar epimerase
MSSLAENMKILITGGAGFIGSNLAITLKSRLPAARVVSMDNLYRRGSELNLPRLKAHGVLFHHGDVRKPGDFPLGPYFLHVEDLCELMTQQISEMDRWDGWIGNVSGGASNAASLCDLTMHCRECLGNEVPIASRVENRPGDLRIFIGDCTRLFARTDWRPRRDVRAIIQDIAVWVREHSTTLESSLEFS